MTTEPGADHPRSTVRGRARRVHSRPDGSGEVPTTGARVLSAAPGGHDERRVMQRHLGQHGITTAEYAVGTAAGAGFAGLLFKLLTGGFGEQLLHTLFDHVLSLLGIG